MSSTRSSEQQEEIINATFRSRGFRAGAILFGAGVVVGTIGAVEHIMNDSAQMDELLAGGYITAMAGALVASHSGIRVVHQFDRDR
jgi:hypothetical protein